MTATPQRLFGGLDPTATQPPADDPVPRSGEPSPRGPAGTLETAALRLATLLRVHDELPLSVEAAGLEAIADAAPRSLHPTAAAVETWAIDGGQATIADARSCSVVVTRTARVRMTEGRIDLEESSPLSAVVLGPGETAALAASLGLGEGTSVDANLLRDAGEWASVATTVEEAAAGSLVLVDGDLEADWRLPRASLAELARRAAQRDVLLVGVTKHSGLARGGAPLVAVLEAEAAASPALGPRSRWWAPVARSVGGTALERLVVVARLDPAARFAFRVDVPVGPFAPAGTTPELALGALAAVADDAAFPGYPYPLTVADRRAACPPWLRAEAWTLLEEALERAGVGAAERERCFADRHRLMERF